MKKKIKIFYLITGLSYGGAELTLNKIISKLNQDIFETYVCSITNEVDLINEIRLKSKKIFILGARNYFGFFKSFILLRRIIKKEKPHILHCFMFHSNLLGRIAATGLDIIVISSIRTKLINNKIGNFFDMITQSLVDVYIVNSNVLFKFINEYGIKKEKIFLLENGVDFDKFEVKRDKDEIRKKIGLPKLPIITMVANFKKQKDYPTMIKALAILNKDINYYFIACGKGQYFEDETYKVKKLINKYNLKNMKLLGFRNNIHEILSITDVWVSSTLYEGQSNSLLEAMAMKKPIVTTNIEENAEVIRNNIEAILVPIKSPKILAKSIKKLIEDKDLSKFLAENAYKKVKQQYNFNSQMKKLIKLYYSLFNQINLRKN